MTLFYCQQGLDFLETHNDLFLPPEGEVLIRGLRHLVSTFCGMIQKTSTYIDILFTKMIL